jgi:hypothetical protein
MFNGNWPTPPTPGRYAEVHVSLSPRGPRPRHLSYVAPTSHKKRSRSFIPRVRIVLVQTLVSREDPHRERYSCSHWRERGGQPRVRSASVLFPRFANCCRLPQIAASESLSFIADSILFPLRLFRPKTVLSFVCSDRFRVRSSFVMLVYSRASYPSSSVFLSPFYVF